MANNYFRFKQFIIHQDRCSMKVCTDACLFGASVADKAATSRVHVSHTLDIGTGTGLVSLLFAQKNPDALIDAVEIEENAFEQAKQNFENSPWKDRLTIFHSDVKDFTASTRYDLIICNPPFYENELLSAEKNKNIAKHDKGLTLKELIGIINLSITDTGTFAILLPYHRLSYFEDLATENKFYLEEKILVKQTPVHNFFRGMLWFGKRESAPATKELTIRDKEGNYTDEFTALLKDYYLTL